MGMFDWLRVDLPELPDGSSPIGRTFQTKDLECFMLNYRITDAGVLLFENVEWELVPPEEWGPEPTDPLDRLAWIRGQSRVKARRWVPAMWTGTLYFYDQIENEHRFNNYVALVYAGTVRWIDRADDHGQPLNHDPVVGDLARKLLGEKLLEYGWVHARFPDADGREKTVRELLDIIVPDPPSADG